MTVPVVAEGSLASTVQGRDLLRTAGAVSVPKLVLVGDAKQLDAVDAGLTTAPARDRAAPASPDREAGREAPQRKAPEPELPAKTKVREMALGLWTESLVGSL